jgi:hypothetical protein
VGPVDCLGDGVGVASLSGDRRIDLSLLVHVEHLEGQRGVAPVRREGPHERGLEGVVVGVVMLLAEEHEARLGELRLQCGLVDPARVGDIPDAADERMADEQPAPPGVHGAWRGGGGLARTGRGAAREQQEGNEPGQGRGPHIGTI